MSCRLNQNSCTQIKDIPSVSLESMETMADASSVKAFRLKKKTHCSNWLKQMNGRGVETILKGVVLKDKSHGSTFTRAIFQICFIPKV